VGMGVVKPVSVRRKGKDRDNFTNIESSFIFVGGVCVLTFDGRSLEVIKLILYIGQTKSD
jgi:hypothetical protein